MSIDPGSLAPAIPDNSNKPVNRAARILLRVGSILLIVSGIFILLNLDTLLGAHPELPLAGEQISYALLFIAGIFTGFHCVGMCGALVVGYTVKAASTGISRYFTHIYYGIGKTLSYTAIGALFGALGAIVTFTPFMRGVAGIAAGVFLVLFGISTLNLFPALSKFRIKTPAFVMRRLGVAYRNNSNPFIIGLLNGLMIICGPLQAMYIMAAGTGQPLEGAKMLFVFGLGTLPVMMGFGVLTSALSRQFAPKIVKASGLIVIALGVIMLNRGLAMIGGGYDYASLLVRAGLISTPPAPDPHAHHHAMVMPVAPEIQTIRMKVGNDAFFPNEFQVKKGVPVRWVIEADAVNYCTHRIVIPSLNLEFDIKPGETIVEFTPNAAGIIPWSCWMGMARGAFLVHEPLPEVTPSAKPAQNAMGHDHNGHAAASPKWIEDLLRKSAAAVETLRRTLRP